VDSIPRTKPGEVGLGVDVNTNQFGPEKIAISALYTAP
jgi:hypothetical protein